MKIALSYAMPGEIASILPPEAQPLETAAGVPFYAIDENITAYCGGIGKVNAAMATQSARSPLTINASPEATFPVT